jgi:peptide deformylase
VNPIVEALSDATFLNYEGCLSVPDLRGEAERFLEIRVRAWDRDGAPWEREIRGLTAGTFQHELDHLDGLLFLDKVFDTRSLTTWEQFEKYHREAFVARITEFVERVGS